jgi:hypothetical protein
MYWCAALQGSTFALPSLEEMNEQLKNPLASFQSSSG